MDVDVDSVQKVEQVTGYSGPRDDTRPWKSHFKQSK